jgi:hypothetical protein
MKRVAGLRATFVVLIVVAGGSVGAHAQLFVPTGRDTLRGLPGVEVLVEPLQPEFEGTGLTAAAIGAAVTEQLRAAGITIYATQRDNPSPSKPYLYIHVNAASDDAGGSVAVALQVHLRQILASLTTESRVVNAMSWDAHSVAAVPAARLNAEVREDVASLVARFVADWRAVH